MLSLPHYASLFAADGGVLFIFGTMSKLSWTGMSAQLHAAAFPWIAGRLQQHFDWAASQRGP